MKYEKSLVVEDSPYKAVIGIYSGARGSHYAVTFFSYGKVRGKQLRTDSDREASIAANQWVYYHKLPKDTARDARDAAMVARYEDEQWGKASRSHKGNPPVVISGWYEGRRSQGKTGRWFQGLFKVEKGDLQDAAGETYALVQRKPGGDYEWARVHVGEKGPYVALSKAEATAWGRVAASTEVTRKNPAKPPHVAIYGNDPAQATADYYPAIFGDYDGDGVPDVDDADPYNYDETPNQVEEVRLSDEIRHLIESRNEMRGSMDELLSELERVGAVKAYGRVKTPFSTINKLRRKRMFGHKGLTDIVGTTVLARDYDHLKKLVSKLRKMGKVIQHSDYYKYPNNGYRAHHFILLRGKVPMEVQAKTERMARINEASHTPYKQGLLNAKVMLQLTDLANKADKGDDRAAAEFARLTGNMKELQKALTKRRSRKNPKPKSMSEEMAKTIIKQIGGYGKLRAMLGKSLSFMRGYDEQGYPQLTMRFTNRKRSLPNVVKITYVPGRDEYNLEFGRIVKYNWKPMGQVNGVYAENLKPSIERATGLYLSL